MRGQGYDGTPNMAGNFFAVGTSIQTEIPEAHNVHCYALCLNMAVDKSYRLPIIRNSRYCNHFPSDILLKEHAGLKLCYNRQTLFLYYLLLILFKFAA